jgi:8-oxo-dGTP pyrophosphatase MutT (NUDIX family)
MSEGGHKIRVSARGVVFAGDKILLNKFGNEYYDFPGGGIMAGETAGARCARRRGLPSRK